MSFGWCLKQQKTKCFFLSTLAVSIFNSVDNKSEVREIDHDVFLSIPMSAVDNEITYQENRTLAREVWEAIQQHTNSDTRYCAVIDHATLTEMDDAQAANDLAELKVSSNFVLIYPEKLASSCLVEVGTAIALGIPCVIFVRDRNDLAYVLQEIGQSMYSQAQPGENPTENNETENNESSTKRKSAKPKNAKKAKKDKDDIVDGESKKE